MITMNLKKGSNRATQAYILTLGEHVFYFSYETCIGYAGPAGNARIANHWGATTGRHFREMKIEGFPCETDADFHAKIEGIMRPKSIAASEAPVLSAAGRKMVEAVTEIAESVSHPEPVEAESPTPEKSAPEVYTTTPSDSVTTPPVRKAVTPKRAANFESLV